MPCHAASVAILNHRRQSGLPLTSLICKHDASHGAKAKAEKSGVVFAFGLFPAQVLTGIFTIEMAMKLFALGLLKYVVYIETFVRYSHRIGLSASEWIF